ncbi:MAG: peptidylprolyl isomerase [Bdellovibrionaceae bacterium]|nr:peptidylprolyl isomerase [Bdellovibrio sp.]
MLKLCLKFFSILSLFLILTAQASAKELVNKILVLVNSEIVLQSDLKKLQSRLNKSGSIDETLLLGEPLSALKNNEKAQLDFLIREKLVESEIKRQNLSITDERVENELSQMAKKNQMTRAEFNNVLAKQGFTVEEYKEVLKARIERQSFFESEIVSKLRITDEDAYGEYQQKNPGHRPSTSEFKIAQIFFSPTKGSAPAALARAKAALGRIHNGESFEDVANRVNETPGAAKDGYLGAFRAGEFLPELERVVNTLEQNQISEVVKSTAGYHIMKVISKRTILDPHFVKVKELIKASLVEKNFQRQLKNWFESKKQDAYIKIQSTNV